MAQGHPQTARPCGYNSLMTNNPYIEQLIEKGYTAQEIRADMKPSLAMVPSFYLERYPDATYDDYQEALHDYLNGL